MPITRVHGPAPGEHRARAAAACSPMESASSAALAPQQGTARRASGSSVEVHSLGPHELHLIPYVV
jgi:hypothetical protein